RDHPSTTVMRVAHSHAHYLRPSTALYPRVVPRMSRQAARYRCASHLLEQGVEASAGGVLPRSRRGPGGTTGGVDCAPSRVGIAAKEFVGQEARGVYPSAIGHLALPPMHHEVALPSGAQRRIDPLVIQMWTKQGRGAVTTLRPCPCLALPGLA